jgi:DNA-binding CsgD family transcriptional regulator
VQAISSRRRPGVQQAGFRARTAVRNLRWRSSVALRALDRLCSGVIVSDDAGRIVEMNRGAQAMVRLEDGLAVRNGQLCARRAFETVKMAKLIAAAAVVGKTGVAAGRMLIGRGDGRPAYVLTVAPLYPDLAIDRPLAMIVIVDPDRHSPSDTELVELFGFSPAEARLAAALMTGKTLTEIATEFGLRVATLRTQLRSILKKVGANRQSDLVRILSSAGIGSVSSLAAGWLDIALDTLQIPLSLTGL